MLNKVDFPRDTSAQNVNVDMSTKTENLMVGKDISANVAVQVSMSSLFLHSLIQN